ncbi:MAG: c-type cytochrome [Terracidiphilus sp.]
MKITSLTPPAAALALLTAAIFTVTTLAQEPQAPQAPAGGEHHMHTMPAPTNLQVLPKDLTGAQVHHIMDGWAGALGTHCSTCHAPDPNAPAMSNGHQRLDYALDIKPDKKTARLMYTMVQDINGNYLSKIDNAGVAVSCGTCHRGHLSPPPFVPVEDHGPPPVGAPPATPPGL